MSPCSPYFFNSREDALLIWTVVIVGYALSKDPRGIGGSILGVVRAVLSPKLLLVFGSATAYNAGLVFAAARLGLWHAGALKETIYWFVGTAIVLVGQAVMIERGAPSPLRRVLVRVLAITALAEFAANLYAFPLGVELPLTLLLIVFVMLQAYAPYDQNATPATRKFIDVVVTLIGITYLSSVSSPRVISDPGGFFNRSTAEDMLVGPALTAALLPVLYGLAWWSGASSASCGLACTAGAGLDHVDNRGRWVSRVDISARSFSRTPVCRTILASRFQVLALPHPLARRWDEVRQSWKLQIRKRLQKRIRV